MVVVNQSKGCPVATAEKIPAAKFVPEVRLDLTMEEARDLLRLLGSIGGAPEGTVRETLNSWGDQDGNRSVYTVLDNLDIELAHPDRIKGLSIS